MAGSGDEGEEGGPGPPNMQFHFFLRSGRRGSGSFSFVYFPRPILLFPLCGGQERRRRGRPAMIGNPDLGQEEVIKKPTLPYGQRRAFLNDHSPVINCYEPNRGAPISCSPLRESSVNVW